MKYITIIVITLLLFSLGIVMAGCEQQEVSEPSPSGSSNAEVLAQYPDDLDAALEELEMLE